MVPVATAKTRSVEQEIEKIIAGKVSSGYKEQDVAAIDAGTAVASHAGDDLRLRFKDVVPKVDGANVVDASYDIHGDMAHIQFEYGKHKGYVWADRQSRVSVHFGKKVGKEHRVGYVINREKKFEDLEAAKGYIVDVLTNREMLDKFVAVVEA